MVNQPKTEYIRIANTFKCQHIFHTTTQDAEIGQDPLNVDHIRHDYNDPNVGLLGHMVGRTFYWADKMANKSWVNSVYWLTGYVQQLDLVRPHDLFWSSI